MMIMKPYFVLAVGAIIITMVASQQTNATLPKRSKAKSSKEIKPKSQKIMIIGQTNQGKVPQDKSAGHVKGNNISAIAKGNHGPSKQFLGMAAPAGLGGLGGMLLDKLVNCPWAACLFSGMDPSVICGGALINPSWVATSAYCANYYRNNLTGVIGIPTVPLPLPVVPVPVPVVTAPLLAMEINPQDVYVYPGYNPDTMANDIALIKLPSPVPMGSTNTRRRRQISLPSFGGDMSINAVLLPSRREATVNFAGRMGMYTTFTQTPMNVSSTMQATISGKIMTNMDCAQYFGGDVITGATMCLANNMPSIPNFSIQITEPVSGSPMVIQNADGTYTLQGIASFGPDMGTTPQVFTRVSPYLNWISATTGIKTP